MPIRLPLLLFALWLGVPGPAPRLVKSQTPADAKGRQTVAASIQAMGGDLYLQVDQRSGDGRIYSFNSNGQMTDAGTPFWFYFRFPADERMELTKKRDIIYIYSGGKGWQITYKGVEAITPLDLSRYQDVSSHTVDVILKQWAQAPNTLIFDQGMTQFQQQPVEAVDFTTADGKTATVDFATDTHLPVRVLWRETDPQTGGILEQSVIYGNWSSIGGIETPFTVHHYEGPQEVQEESFNNISFTPISAELFTPTTHKH